MKKLMFVAAIGLAVVTASAFTSKGTSTSDTKLSMYEAADTVPGKKKGDTAKHRYPKDTTRKMPPKS
ncbi:MAG: hypothetical protein EOO09_07665 [Chitinophagaceae bacterium]|nr:MAG: hypothetical protein EOO09_07665 [Chitinophagaceae bacterium]